MEQRDGFVQHLDSNGHHFAAADTGVVLTLGSLGPALRRRRRTRRRPVASLHGVAIYRVILRHAWHVSSPLIIRVSCNGEKKTLCIVVPRKQRYVYRRLIGKKTQSFMYTRPS